LERLPEPSHAAQDPQVVHQKASALAASLPCYSVPSSRTFVSGAGSGRALKPIFEVLGSALPKLPISDDFGGFTKIVASLFGLENTAETLKSSEITHVRTRWAR